ncbi:MAG TPA: hypothetical protein VHY08_19670 [Bacillota bacterium]|nr:hypothetical protein [Bacillota bacterium]
MGKKLAYSLSCFLVMLIFLGIPACAEERTVLGISAPPFAFSYEKEGADNRSWIVNGLIFVDNTFEHFDISLNGYGGMRFYQGDAPWRFYEGVYGLVAMKGIEVIPNNVKKTAGLIGALGVEGRFGVDHKARFFAEAGWKFTYTHPNISENGFTFGAGVGYGI